MLSYPKQTEDSYVSLPSALTNFKDTVFYKINEELLVNKTASIHPASDAISAIRRAEEKQALAEFSSQAKSEFLTTMSHELRTPMGAIIGLTQLMLETKLDGRQAQYMTVLQSSAKALMVIVEGLLDVGKIESNSIELKHAPFNMGMLLDQIVGIMSVNAQEKAIGLTLNYGFDRSENFIGDDGRIRQIIINLIGNAIKFTEAGQVTVGFSAGHIVNGKRQISISVNDMGIGIPKDKMDMIFTRFAQANTAIIHKYGGTGLGLAISRALTENMGGSLAVTSAVGIGSTFTLNLELLVEAKGNLMENVVCAITTAQL